MDSVEELRGMLENIMLPETLLDEIECWFGAWKMQECYRDICKSWDIELESEE